jgi:hypothetical protein
LFTTSLLPPANPKPEEWWYYGLDHGQHIGLFTLKALHSLADRFNLRLLSYRSYHLLTDKKINEFNYRLAVRWAQILSPFLVCKLLDSLTQTDMLKMTENSCEL